MFHRKPKPEAEPEPPEPIPQPIKTVDLGQPLVSRDARLWVVAQILRDDADEPNPWVDLLKGVGDAQGHP